MVIFIIVADTSSPLWESPAKSFISVNSSYSRNSPMRWHSLSLCQTLSCNITLPGLPGTIWEDQYRGFYVHFCSCSPQYAWRVAP